MNHRKAYSSVAEAMVLPRVIALDKNLYGAAFFLMKLLPAWFMLERARDAGLVEPGTVVVETTSGTFGLALAIVCKLAGYRLIVVSDSAIDLPFQRRLEELSARVEIVREPSANGGLQGARLERLNELRAQHPNHFWPSQYHNPHNPGAYARLAELLVEVVGSIDCLVGTVGSGGSMSGTGGYLRLLFPHLHVIGVDTHGSVLFGQPDHKTRLLRGLGNSLMPKNLKHSTFDEVHWLAGAEAFAAARELHASQALFMGPTSGAAYRVAKWWAAKHPDAKVVTLFPDEGYRYQETVYNDQWLRLNGISLSGLATEPRLVSEPLSAGPEWSHMHWDNRRYEEVMGSGFQTVKDKDENLVCVY
ncbi:MAG: pyridoxal-5-phosphate-dependent protein subunit beta [Acidobacteria bacterium]|nr:MAG: pyridoxal-5-phosphate-dependent protein subunit beta [Acidobacteriota bacterium]